MTDLVLFVLIFVAAGGAALGGNLLLGKLVRPHRPSPEKGTVYECGEPTIGSAWVQFDLRFYVVALLFVIFDVELAFFFPWAVVFGSATRAADTSKPAEVRVAAAAEIVINTWLNGCLVSELVAMPSIAAERTVVDGTAFWAMTAAAKNKRASAARLE